MNFARLVRGPFGLAIAILLLAGWLVVYNEDSENVSLWTGSLFSLPLAAWVANWIEGKTRDWDSFEQPEHPDWEIRRRGDDLGDDVFP